MKHIIALLAFGLLSNASSAQNFQMVEPLATPAPALQATQIDQEALLKHKIETLKSDNERLRQENQSLSTRITEFTKLGGSEVHAYCSARSVSQNTAGASESCGAYACNAVNGLCKDRCDSVADCATNFACADTMCTQ